MPFKKGQSGNITGKPPGAKNKMGLQLREMINDFLTENFSLITADFKSLPVKDRYKLYCDLLQYGLPKLQATSTEINFDRMTDEQLEQVIESLKGMTKVD